jgi:predicted ATPase
MAGEINHLPTRVQILHQINWLNFFNGDVAAVHEMASKAIDESTEIGLFNFMPMSVTLRGWADSLDGDPGKGVSEIRQGLDTLRATGSSGSFSTATYMLAEAIAKSAEWEAAAPALETAIENMNRYSELLMMPKAYSLMGDLLLRQSPGDQETPETWYNKAIDYARDQKTRMWELHATTRLARLWQSQGRTAEARDLLGPMYGWFTEGFDATDLVDAKSLLDQL